MRRLYLTLAVAGALALPQRTLAAQAARALVADTAAWRPLLEHVVSRLALHIVRAAFDTTSHPWRMTFPHDGEPWSTLGAHLRVALRARSVTPQDTTFHELDVDTLRVVGDTVRTRVTTATARRCAGPSRIDGYGRTDEISVVRHALGWWEVVPPGQRAEWHRLDCRIRRQ